MLEPSDIDHQKEILNLHRQSEDICNFASNLFNYDELFTDRLGRLKTHHAIKSSMNI